MAGREEWEGECQQPWAAEQSPAGPRGPGTHAPLRGLGAAQAVAGKRHTEPGRLQLLSAFSEAVITLDFKQLPLSWPHPGTYRVLE